MILDVQQCSSKVGLASTGNVPGGSQIQLERDALGQLISLSKAASLAEYLQQTLNQRLDIVSEQASINTRLAKMGSGDTSLQLDTDSLDANFYSAAFQKFQRLHANYEGLVSQAQASVRCRNSGALPSDDAGDGRKASRAARLLVYRAGAGEYGGGD